jgi:hypothetical protein
MPNHKTPSPDPPDRRGLPLALNQNAESADPSLPAFLARPSNTPVYHGFSVLEDVSVDEFTFGMITDFEAEPSDYGDAFVIAPDGSRAGLIWEIDDQPFVTPSPPPLPPTDTRWGVFNVGFPVPMRSYDAARRNLEAILPELRPYWEQWRTRHQ